MKLPARKISFFILLTGLALSSASRAQIVLASQNLSASFALTSTPWPTVLEETLEATATVDPASIGDTSGVIAIGMIVVFIILMGVLWGSYEFRQESRTTRHLKE
jgi:cytochrome bd-type quinol oxidase subunit 2